MRIVTLLVLSCRGSFLSVMVMILTNIIEPEHDKTNEMTCAPSKDSEQPGYSAQFDQSLRYPPYGKLKTHSFFTQTTNILIRLCRCPG